jgi:FtsP/CotA-like multicopper oxidase with cupredoxin domain
MPGVRVVSIGSMRRDQSEEFFIRVSRRRGAPEKREKSRLQEVSEMEITTETQGRTITVPLEARETEWQFAPGRSIRGYGFNGHVPGPLIEAELGDELVVELTNRLAEPTTIHWHGLRVPAEMDGTEMVQRPVEPGKSYEYRFVPPDAATFWYYSHVNETEQLERGLYGALVVRGPDEPTVDREQVLVLDDLNGPIWR